MLQAATTIVPEEGFSEAQDQALIDKAKALRPLLARFAQQHENQGELSPEVVQALDEGGFWKMAVPRRWGGLCTSAYTMARVAAELAKGCPSSAWVIGVMNSGIWLVSLMPDALQEDIFANGVPRVSSVGVPKGKARKVDGGYLVSGRWGYGSGSHHAQWLHCPIGEPDGGEGPGGLFIAPQADMSIVSTWDVAGMKGTGSDTIVAEDLFVPEHRVVLFKNGGMGPERPGAQHTGEVSDYWAMMPLLRAKGLGVLVGTVEALLECALGDNSDRLLVHTKYAHKRDSQVFQEQIGQSAAEIRAAGMLMDNTTRSLDVAALERRATTYDERVANRGDAALSVTLLGRAADRLMDLMGSSGFSTSNPAQRYWRDFSTGSRHAVTLPSVGYEVFGRAQLGFPIEDNITLPDFI